ELSHHLSKAQINGDVLAETAELRSIRESILRARMSKMLQIPLEMPWIQGCASAIIKSIRSVWKTRTDDKEAAACAQWLVNLLDLRGFAPSAIPGGERAFATYARASQIMQLLTPLSDLSRDRRDTYYKWIDAYLLTEIKNTQPEVFSWIVAQASQLISHAVKISNDRRKT